MWDVIRDLVADGTTLLLTTQYLDEADELADAISVIDHGRVIAHGTPASSRPPSAASSSRSRSPTPTPAPPARSPPLVTGAGARRRRRPHAHARRSTPGPAWPPPSSAPSTTPASPSTTSRSTTRRSTTCSSPSPATPRRRRPDRRPRPRADREEVLHDHDLLAPERSGAIADGTPPASAATEWLGDVAVLTRRNLVHVRREPAQLSDATVQPVLFTLLFVYIFGSAMVLPGGGSYKDFAIGGLLIMNLTTASMGTAVGLSTDLATGVIDRFRTLPMSRSAILAGRTFSDLLAAILCGDDRAAHRLVIGWRPDHGIGRRDRRARRRPALRLRPQLVHRLHRPRRQRPRVGPGRRPGVLFPLAFISSCFVPTQGLPDRDAGHRRLEPGLGGGRLLPASSSATRTRRR